ncbi:MAG: ActS/PrrB/RegB family redox-sensitive histidine kinase [Alphaproteobacteria bacterium]|nr:ActS/PrrB/RegB family redox-sensitive histidine kinase [Alphaproteobacteria bacterium]
MAVAGQSGTLLLVYFAFGYPLPILYCAAAILTSAALNTVLALRYPVSHRLTNREATFYLAFDVAQLAALLYLTGGIQNPFALMFLAPVVIAATILNLSNTIILAFFAFAAVSVIGIWHRPLPWPQTDVLALPPLYQAGIWAALVLGIGFTSVYAWRIASESARMSAGLSATQLALSRERRLASIGALATAAAHELGTPLGTIAVVARELERVLPENSPEIEDARLLREQAERCRAIIAGLAHPGAELLGGVARLPLGALLEDLAHNHRGEVVDVAVRVSGGPGEEPQVWRVPELLHGLGNILENAADFARERVTVEGRWDAGSLYVAVDDDGPGFAPEIFEALGEPYVTSRPGHRAPGETEMVPEAAIDGHEGMGLGFFIAKVLLEQSGGLVKATNPPGGGARVAVSWARGVIDGEVPPASEVQ